MEKKVKGKTHLVRRGRAVIVNTNREHYQARLRRKATDKALANKVDQLTDLVNQLLQERNS